MAIWGYEVRVLATPYATMRSLKNKSPRHHQTKPPKCILSITDIYTKLSVDAIIEFCVYIEFHLKLLLIFIFEESVCIIERRNNFVFSIF